MTSSSNRPPRSFDRDLTARITLCFVIIVLAAFLIPGFGTLNNIAALIQVLAPIGIAALGVGVTMIAGEFDLSIGSSAVLGGVLAIRFADDGPVAAFLIPVLVAGVLGALQGLLISWLKLSSLVVTIGTLILFQGVAYVIANENSVSLTNFDLGVSLSTRYWIFSPMSVVFLVLAMLVWLFLHFTRLGHELYAIGGGRREAAASGVSVRRPLVVAFAFSACMGALTGALVSVSAGGATPTGFSDVLLTSIAAAVIGGVALSGGRGSTWGIVLGAFALAVISDAVTILGAPVFVTDFLTGALLLAALAAEMLSGRTPRRRRSASHPSNRKEVRQ
jgi:ribose transport system permease protein